MKQRSRIKSHSTFQDAWFDNPELKDWVQKVKNDVSKAKCALCIKEINISSMGVQALSSHMKSQKHLSLIAARNKTIDVGSLLTSEKSKHDQSTREPLIPKTITELNNSQTIEPDGCTMPMKLNTLSNSLRNISDKTMPDHSVFSQKDSLMASKNGTAKSRGVKTYFINDDVTRAEILWCLQSVVGHKSIRTAGNDVTMLKKMFPDSEIASKMKLQRSKVGYTIQYGLAPYFKEELVSVVSRCSRFVAGFDEALNKVCKKQQMDINLRFWDPVKNEVCTRYYTSAFLGRSRAADLLEAFKSSLEIIPIVNMIQVSMDGPNVNLKFLKDLKVYLKASENSTTLLDIGSCGLHGCHNSFKNAIKATDWNIVPFLRCLYNVFKDFPSRRALYVEYTGSDLFPLKFGATRWLENADVAERGFQMIPSLRKFVQKAAENNTKPTSASYKLVEEFVKDPLLGPKLAFFKTLACDVEPFLREFQSDWPLLPFLHSALNSLLQTIMERFVKSESVNSHVDVMNEENLLKYSDIEIGFETNKEFKKCKNVSQLEIATFRRDCKKCFQKFVTKLTDRSPLKYKLTEAASSLNPETAIRKVGRKRFKNLLQILNDSNWIDCVCSEKALRQYTQLCSSSAVIESCKKFRRARDRVDHFWIEQVKTFDEDYSEFKVVIQTVLILSHGNANVERGFSINKESIFENMAQETLVAHRRVYDAVNSHGGIDNIDINKSLIHAARNAHSKYLEDQKKKKTEQENSKKKESNKEMMKIAAKDLKAKKASILENARKCAEEIDLELKQLINQI